MLIRCRAHPYKLSGFAGSRILAIDRAEEVANCSVTLYRHDEKLGPRGSLALDRFNFVAPLEEAGAPVTSKPDANVAAR